MSNFIEFEQRERAFQNRLSTFGVKNREHKDVKAFLEDAFSIFNPTITSLLDIHFIVKCSICFHGIFEKVTFESDGNEKRIERDLFLHTNAEIIDFETDLVTFYDEYVVKYFINKISEVELRGSGFTLKEIIDLEVQTSSFDPYNGGSFIELPKKLSNRKAIINVKNNDNECFKYAILSAIFPPAHNAHRVENYKKLEKKLNFDGINFPVGLKDLKKFEAQNPSISVNVYMWVESSENVRTLRLTKNVKQNHVHLMLLTEELKDSNTPKTHYCWIKNLSALLSKQISKNCRRKLFCDRCLNHFIELKKLEEHRVACFNQNAHQIVMPLPGLNDKIEYKNFYKQLPVEFVVYADIESILRKPNDDNEFSASKKTTAYQKHEVYSIGYYGAFSNYYDDSKYRSKSGADCIDWFVKEMVDVAHMANNRLKYEEPMDLSMEHEVLFIWAEECHICGKLFTDEKDKVRDHCHTTGQFRGAAHNDCNLNYQRAKYVTIVFHNLSNYDAHFIIKAFAQNIEGSVSIIPHNDEVYISFTKHVDETRDEETKRGGVKLRFIDSLKFMASSLEYLASLLPSEKKEILRSQFEGFSGDQLKLLEKKGVFCYDYVDSVEKLSETSMPPKESFYNHLNESHISDEDYAHAENVWGTFKIKTLGEYADLYMKTDILLLADVFENFRYTCRIKYNLDPAHYFTAPGLSFDAMLKQTKVELELITDVDMLLFVERGIRGGISQCSKRYAKANNKYTENFNPTADSKFLIYLDANNLYGWSMMEYLPLNEFTWCEKEFTAEEILSIADDSEIGYMFEVDLEYPEHLHDTHQDYPFCAEHKLVPNTKNDKKLLLTLDDKKEYVLHYRMLKCALRHGLVLKKVHKVLQFQQSPWLKTYIELNTKLRTEALNEFEKNFYKLLINAIFGKTIENVRGRADIRLRSKWQGRYGLRSYVAQPNFKKYKIFDEDFAAVEMNKTHVCMEKPIAIGMSVLDISKVLMYDFYHGHLKDKYGEKVQMVYTDTDSFILEVKTECFYKDMLHDIEMYDTSDFAEPNAFNIPRVNKKVPGKFKDELKGQILTEFVGLRSKMYSVMVKEVEKIKKAKGVKKSVLKKSITFQDYVDCLEQDCTVVRNQNSIRSKMHQVYTISQTKIALSPYDNKRYILDGNINTLPWGHYKIPKK